jgi:Core-2/I-Branching enzyme
VATIKYLITAYSQQSHLQRLCATLLRLDASNSIVVQYDQSKDPLDRALLPPPVVVVDTPTSITWGDGSYLDAILVSLSRCLDDDWQWLALLSGQDYPIRPTQELIAHLADGQTEGILGSGIVPPPAHRTTWTEEQRRYWFRHTWIPERLWRLGGGPRGIGRICRLIVALPLVRNRAYYRSRTRGASGGIGVLVRNPPFDEQRPCRVGMDYFLLSRTLVQEALLSAREDRALLDQFRRAAIPSEGWFHTVLGTKHEDALQPQPFTFSRFRGSANPRVLQEADLDDAIAARRFFARKFTQDSGKLLDRIDVELLGIMPSSPAI